MKWLDKHFVELKYSLLFLKTKNRVLVHPCTLSNAGVIANLLYLELGVTVEARQTAYR